MEWVNMMGFLLTVSATIVGLGSFIAASGTYKTDAADEKAVDHEVDLQMAA